MKDDSVYLKQILEAVGKIESFTSSFSKENFITDPKTQSAVIMQLALIGEMAKKVSTQTRTAIDLPWKDIAGFRDRAIHDYFEIDLDVVWETILTDLPVLKNRLQGKRP